MRVALLGATAHRHLDQVQHRPIVGVRRGRGLSDVRK
jgi:hypothetical protein